MAHGEEIGRLGAGETLAADRALLIIERSGAVEPDQVRGAGRRRHFIRQRSRFRIEERSPFHLAAGNIEQTAVADGAHAPTCRRLIFDSVTDHIALRRHGD